MRAVTGGAQVLAVQGAFHEIDPEGMALEGEGHVRKEGPLIFRKNRKEGPPAPFTLEDPLLNLPWIGGGWFRQSGGILEVVGLIPERGEFPPPVKKTPSPASCPKHCGVRPNSQGDGPPCTGGAGVRGFSWPAVKRSFYLSNNAVGAVLPPAGQVFFHSNLFVKFLCARNEKLTCYRCC